MQLGRPSGAIREAIRCHQGGHPVQLGRTSGTIRIRCNASHAARCVIKRGTRWHSVAVTCCSRATRAFSSASAAACASLTRSASAALAAFSAALARSSRTASSRCRACAHEGRSSEGQSSAIRGNQRHSVVIRSISLNQGSSRGLPLPPRPRARLSSPQPPPAASAGVPVGPGGEGGWRAVVSMGAVVSAPFSLVPGMRASAASNVCWSAFSLAAASNHMHSR